MARLVFDIGGTNLRMALAEGGSLRDPRKGPTPRRPEDAVDALARYALASGTAIDSVNGGVPGVVREGVAVDLPHLPGWNGFDIAAALERSVGADVTIGNDADLGGIGEAVLGAGKGERVVAYLAVGTGVGGSVVEDGRSRSQGRGFEPGRQVLELSTGRTLQDLVGGTALSREFGPPAASLPARVYEERTRALAVGIANAVRHWAPDVVVLNGSLLNDANGFRIERIADELARIEEGMPRLARAAFGDASGLYGAACLGD